MGNKIDSKKKLKKMIEFSINETLVRDFKANLLVAFNKLQKNYEKKKSDCLTKKSKIRELLKSGDYNKALIHVEFLNRDEDMAEAYLVLIPLLEALKEKTNFIFGSNTQDNFPPQDVRYLLDSFVYSSFRINIEEFNTMREILSSKFGKEYLDSVNSNANKYVDTRLVKFLSLVNYQKFIKIQKLSSLAQEDKIEVIFPEEWFTNLELVGDANDEAKIEQQTRNSLVS